MQTQQRRPQKTEPTPKKNAQVVGSKNLPTRTAPVTLDDKALQRVVGGTSGPYGNW